MTLASLMPSCLATFGEPLWEPVHGHAKALPPSVVPVRHGGLVELTTRFQTLSSDGKVSLALTLSLSSLQQPQQEPHHAQEETANPSLLPAVPAETGSKAQVSSAQALVVLWSQLKPPKSEVLPSGQCYPRPALV